MKTIDPDAIDIINEINTAMDEATGRKGVSVTVTADTPREEKLFELTDGFIKEGNSLEEAQKKAGEWLAMMESIDTPKC